MTREEKIDIVADILEVESNEIEENKLLEEYETWDSIAILSVISEVERLTGKYMHAKEVKALKTIGDIMGLLEA